MVDENGESRDRCPECNGDCFVPAITEYDHIHPDARGAEGEPLALCPTCGGDGEATDFGGSHA